jgi:hypothetical protein
MKNSLRHATVSAGILLVTAFILLLPRFASAQIDTGSVVGIVSDPSGAAIPGATVTLSNEASGVSRSVTTNGDGEYQFAAVIPGRIPFKLPRKTLNQPSARTSKLMCSHDRPLTLR